MPHGWQAIFMDFAFPATLLNAFSEKGVGIRAKRWF
jgi:hypothetical protein